jgi:hypothetical protein
MLDATLSATFRRYREIFAAVQQRRAQNATNHHAPTNAKVRLVSPPGHQDSVSPAANR